MLVAATAAVVALLLCCISIVCVRHRFLWMLPTGTQVSCVLSTTRLIHKAARHDLPERKPWVSCRIPGVPAVHSGQTWPESVLHSRVCARNRCVLGSDFENASAWCMKTSVLFSTFLSKRWECFVHHFQQLGQLGRRLRLARVVCFTAAAFERTRCTFATRIRQ